MKSAFRPSDCGPRYSKKFPNAYTKEQLIFLAILVGVSSLLYEIITGEEKRKIQTNCKYPILYNRGNNRKIFIHQKETRINGDFGTKRSRRKNCCKR